MSLARDIVEGALMGIGLGRIINVATNAAVAVVVSRHKRRRERIAAEQEWRDRVEAEAAIAQIAAQFRANVIAADAAARAEFDEQRRTCACGECKQWRAWNAARNN